MAESVADRKSSLQAQLQTNDPYSPARAMEFLAKAWANWRGSMVPQAPNQKVMRFDSEGRTEPLKERVSPADIDLADWAGGMVGGIGRNPLHGREALRANKQWERRAPPGTEPYAKQIFEPQTTFFHGTHAKPGDIRREGFKAGQKPEIMGEPAGLSMSPKFGVAEGFGPNVYRVHPGLRPDEVLNLNDPAQAAIYRKIVANSLGPLEEGRAAVFSPEAGVSSFTDALKMARVWYPEGSEYGHAPFANLARSITDDVTRRAVADQIGQGLIEQDYRGLLYHPQRYGEFELRSLYPEDVVPIEVRRRRQFGDPDIFGDPTVTNAGRRGRPETYPTRLGEAQERFWGQAEPLFNRDARIQTVLDDAIREYFGLKPANRPSGLELQAPWPLTKQEAADFIFNKLDKTPSRLHGQVVVPSETWTKLEPDVIKFIQSKFPGVMFEGGLDIPPGSVSGKNAYSLWGIGLQAQAKPSGMTPEQWQAYKNYTQNAPGTQTELPLVWQGEPATMPGWKAPQGGLQDPYSSEPLWPQEELPGMAWWSEQNWKTPQELMAKPKSKGKGQ